MKLPFIHSSASGLYISDTDLVWVSGVRLGPRMRYEQRVHERVEEGGVHAALARLVERVHPSTPYVVTHLDPLHVRQVVVQGPALDDAADVEAWIQTEARSQLPPGAPVADFAVRDLLLEQTEEQTRCLLILASREAVDERVALLEKVGLRPLCISSLDVTSGEVLQLNPAFIDGWTAVLLLRRDDATLLQYQEGLLQTLEPLPFGSATTNMLSLLEEVGLRMAPVPDRLLVIGEAATEVVVQAQEAHLIPCPVREGAIDGVSSEVDAPMSALDVPAAALVLEQLFGTPEALNFLAPEAAYTWRQDVEKHEATRAVLLLGGFVGLLYLLLILGTHSLRSRQAMAEMALQHLAGRITEIQQAEEAVQQLERDVAQAEHLVAERTHAARIMAEIGRRVPEGVWLETLALEVDDQAASHLTLVGAAYEEGRLATCLERLEQASFAANIRLLYAEEISTTALYKHIKIEDQPLTRFEIRMALVTSFGAYSGKQREP